MTEKTKQRMETVGLSIFFGLLSTTFLSGRYVERVDNLKDIDVPRIEKKLDQIIECQKSEHDSSQVFRMESRMDRKEIRTILEHHIGGKK